MLLSMVLLYSFAVCICQANPVYNVQPLNHNNGTQYCPYPCFNLSQYATNSNMYLTSNVQLYFLKGTHVLNKAIDIVHVTNISIIGQSNMKIIIECSNSGGHLFIQDSQNIKIQNIKFAECGFNNKLRSYQGHYNHLTPAVAFLHCTNLQVTFVDFENSFGSSLAVINARRLTVLHYVSFYHTKSLDHNNVAQSGLTIEFTALYQPAIISLNNCHFYNFDGMMRDEEAALFFRGGTAMTIISDCGLSPKATVQITIDHCTFVNNTLTIGPLIQMDISTGHINISFTDIVITKNSRRGGWPLNQIKFTMSLIELFSHQCAFSSKKSMQWVEFKNSLLSFNSFTQNIFGCALHSNWSVHLFIEGCIFSLNKLLMSFMVLTYLATLSIKNTIFNSNRACIDATDLSDIEACCFLTSNADIKLFSGHVEFTDNYVAQSRYFLVLYGHIFLKENTLLNISSNYLDCHMYGISIIKVVNPTIDNRSTLLPCFIQYISSSKNLDEEFNNELIPLNYSIVIKSNSQCHSTILGQNLKDCYWLPNSPFKTVHPGVVSKKFVHFDRGENPTGDYYNDCLCYKGNQTAECLYDEIDPVYPGQEIEIGFKLTNIDPLDKMQFYDQVKIFHGDNTIFSLHIDGSNFSKITAEQCSYKQITIYLYKNIYEEYQCSIAHNHFYYYKDLGFHKRIVTHSIYYINILPCPPGFFLYDGKCICHPKLDHILIKCHIEDQTVYRPSTVWMMYSNTKRDIVYADNCPFHYCLSSSLYMQLTDPDKQCNPNRRGILCGQCSEGYSAVFGSTRCKKCSNGWLATIGMFLAAGLLLILIPMVDKIAVYLKGVNIAVFALYINILNANRLNISGPVNDWSSFAFVLVSLLNFDLGFEMCFYNGMTEYSKLWLQFIFPVTLVCTMYFLMHTSKCFKTMSSRNGKSILALCLLTLYNKVALTLCKEFFFYKRLKYLEDEATEYVWSVYPSIPLFGPLHLPYFIPCLVAAVVVIVINVVTLFPVVFGKTCNSYLLFPSYFQSILKQKHKYWLGVELLLRVVIAVLTAFEPQLSLLLSAIIIIAFVCCLGFTSPFKDTKNTILESVFTINLAFIFMLALYYGENQTVLYWMVINVTVIVSLATFMVMLACPSKVLSWKNVYQCFHTIWAAIRNNVRCTQ